MSSRSAARRIDEIQLALELLRAIVMIIDLDPRPGRFLLTG
ncbi:MAG: hypothetical protein ACRDN0_17520 [Trebonia sp.]